MSAFVHAPIASVSGQFPLAAPSGTPVPDMPSVAGDRPWGLRRVGRVHRLSSAVPATAYDHVRQVTIDPTGRPVVRPGGPVAGDPTAPTTGTVDGEDPPSAEDYKNDYAPDHPYAP